MSSCQDNGLSPYEDIRVKQLAKLGVHENPDKRCIMYILADIDPDDMLKHRARQKMELGRYGRQSVLQWDSILLIEFLQYYKALVDVVKAENSRTESIPGFEDH